MKKQEKVNKVSRGPGRPQYEIKWSRGKFTFTDLMILNGVDPKTGKGKLCSKLTLIKALKRDAKQKSNSLIVQLKGVLAPSNSKNGLGRKQLVYCRRSMIRPPKDEVTIDMSQDTNDYEAQKAALLAPANETVTTVPEVTDQVVPVITIAPAPEVTPEVTVTPPVAVADVAPLSDPVVEAPPVPELVNS